MKIIDKKERQETKAERKKGVTQAIVNMRELNDFAVRLS